MKRVVCFLISALILMTFACVFAGASNEYIYVLDGNEYTVEFKTGVPDEKQETIANALVGDNGNAAQPYGLGCTLFGHDYKYTSAIVIQHKVFPTSPRCVEYYYDVTYCEDCDYTEETLLGSSYIDCCPKD